LGNAHGLETDAPAAAACYELSGEAEGELLARQPSIALRMIGVIIGSRCVAEDDVINGNPEVEPTLVVEVNDFVRGIWRDILGDVTEGPAVTHGQQGRTWRGGEAKNRWIPSRRGGALRQCVFAGGTWHAVDDRFGDQETVDGVLAQDFVYIQVVSLPDSQGGPFFCDEVEAGSTWSWLSGKKNFIAAQPGPAGRCG